MANGLGSAIGLTNAAATSASEFGKLMGADVYKTLKNILKESLNKAAIDFEIGFEKYIKNNVEHLANVKTILNRYVPVKLTDIYEDLILGIRYDSSFISDMESINESDFVNSGEIKRAIITGTAGCGKSFFMKRTFLRHCEINTGYLPVYIELRSFNSVSSPSIIKKAIEIFSEHIDFIDPNFFELIAKRHKIAFILDGFDELYNIKKAEISRQIDRLAYNYPNSKIYVSSRPDDRFTSWPNFTEYCIAPMKKAQCLSLIKKSKYPAISRDKFYKSVEKNLFRTHGEYLSNPLLTYVMIFTSDQFSEFPEEISEFYYKAFEVLYRGHDVMKSGDFSREVKCQIKQKNLEEIFSYFCALSFRDEIYEYSEDLAKSILEKSLVASEKKDIDIPDFMHDLVKNYCLLIQDGTSYTFIHRSFQEYFAAFCISKTEIFDFYEYNKNIICSRMESRRYFSMIREVSREKFESRFLIPLIGEFVADIFPLKKINEKGFISKFYLSYEVMSNGRLFSIRFGTGNIRTKWYYVEDLAEMALLENLSFSSITEFERNFVFAEKIKSDEGEDYRYRFDFAKISAKDIRKLAFYAHYRSLADRLNAFVKMTKAQQVNKARLLEMKIS